jgi:hypothetical protein
MSGVWAFPPIGMPEVVGITTAILVAWNAWRANKTAKVVNAVHTLTNSAMGAQLKINVDNAQRAAVMAHRIADITKQEGDIAAAKAADLEVIQQQAVYQDHVVRQAKVDLLND